jgi:hypothetical protein
MGRMVKAALFLFVTFPFFTVGVVSQQSPAFPDHGVNEAQFTEVLDVIEAVYGPLIEHRGLKFIIQRDWSDDTVDAMPFSSSSFMGLTMYGGLARYRGMTQDSFALVACHELGHLLGGFPQGNLGLANEGQADYFATSKCLRRIFAEPTTNSFSRLSFIDPTAEKACAGVFKESSSRGICVRSAMAALSASVMTTGWGNEPEIPAFDTPDPYRTTVTDDRHMPKQCRLDTQFQGALCAKSVDEDFSNTGPEPGACTQSQGFTVGLRPRCWYYPPKSEPDLVQLRGVS